MIEVVELGYVGDDLAVAAGLRLDEPEPYTFLKGRGSTRRSVPLPPVPAPRIVGDDAPRTSLPARGTGR